MISIDAIGQKNNQTWVSGSTDNAGNLVNLVSNIIRLPTGLGFLGLHRRPMIDLGITPYLYC